MLKKCVFSTVRLLGVGVATFALASCSSFSRVETPNQNKRVNSIVVHFTAVDKKETFRLFQDETKSVSAHFVVTEERIYQMADLSARTYHAGKSYWHGRHSLNDTSIGIEIVQEVNCNQREEGSYKFPPQVCVYPDFSPKLVNNILKTMDKIYQYYPDIKTVDVIGHQDIAPLRKLDPGPRFPWQYLSQQGYGAWYDTADYLDEYQKLSDVNLSQTQFLQALTMYGYQDVEPLYQAFLIGAFQTHFTPDKITGTVTKESMAAILALLKKYYPEKYEQITATFSTENE